MNMETLLPELDSRKRTLSNVLTHGFGFTRPSENLWIKERGDEMFNNDFKVILDPEKKVITCECKNFSGINREDILLDQHARVFFTHLRCFLAEQDFKL